MEFKGLKNNKLFKTGVNYSAASTLYSICTMIVGMLNMRWIGPELLGIWQSVSIVNAYVPFFQLGVQSALNVELPKLLGAKKDNDAINLVRTSLAFAVALSFIFFIISFVCIVYLIINGTDAKVVWGAVAIALLTICQCYHLQFIATYRSAKAFDRLTIIYYIRSIVTIGLIIVIYFFNYYGLLIYNVVSELLAVILMWYYAPYRSVSPRFIKDAFSTLLNNGLFLSVIRFANATIESLPRLILLNYGNVVSVGLFSPALVLGQFMNLVPNQLTQFLNPQFGYKYGQSGKAQDMWGYFKKLTIYVPLIMLPIAVLGCFLIPYVIELLFPKYVASAKAIQIMLFGFVFSTRYFTRGFLSSLRAYKEYLGLLLTDIVLFAGIPALLIHFYPNDLLEMVALGLSVAYFISYYLNIVVVRKVIFLKKYNKGK